MAETRVSIEEAESGISDLVNRVACGEERVLLTSGGEPRAAIVSMDDYERLEQKSVGKSLTRWESWLAGTDESDSDSLVPRPSKPLDVEALWQAVRADLEEQDAGIPGR